MSSPCSLYQVVCYDKYVDITRWGKAVREVVEAAEKSDSQLAKKAQLYPMKLSRLLRGVDVASPDANTLRKIHRAAAELTGYPGVESYLDFEAAACGMLPEEAFVRAATWCLSLYLGFFRADALARVPKIIEALDKTKRQKLAVDLARAFHSRIIEELLPPARPTGFSAVYAALEKAGIADKLVSEQSNPQREREQFEWIVRRELAVKTPRASEERSAAARRIIEAHDKATYAALNALTAAMRDGGVVEIISTTENGGTRTDSFGRTRAGLGSFSAPGTPMKINTDNLGRKKRR